MRKPDPVSRKDIAKPIRSRKCRYVPKKASQSTAQHRLGQPILSSRCCFLISSSGSACGSVILATDEKSRIQRKITNFHSETGDFGAAARIRTGDLILTNGSGTVQSTRKGAFLCCSLDRKLLFCTALSAASTGSFSRVGQRVGQGGKAGCASFGRNPWERALCFRSLPTPVQQVERKFIKNTKARKKHPARER